MKKEDITKYRVLEIEIEPNKTKATQNNEVFNGLVKCSTELESVQLYQNNLYPRRR